ncbi:ABC transporter permease [Allorhizobium borbori]|uniref:Putative spermidine/putrescine transport system permease protein n=1 Tax=Allorhizobium borbori TaxID=485907 RepID=A0A7W6K884_9HYPH|nr:ABC transporter permease [Allorhizobium borbori]MBB4105965.1 putative spermidine/putrescine transport system permease protein [Allorhizobium borbori]
MDRYPQSVALIAPGVAIMIAAFAVPVAMMLSMGIHGDQGFTFEYILAFVTDPFYLGIGWRTVKLALIISVVCVLVGVPLAYVMARGSRRLRTFLLICVTLPLMTSVVVRTFGWMVILGRNGLIADMLFDLGLVRRNFSLMQTETAIVIGMVQVVLPFMVLTVLGVMQRLDPRLEEAARVMGCTFVGSLRRVVLPGAMPGIVSGFLLVFSLSASYFVTPMLLGGARLPTVAASIYEAATKTLEWNFAAAQSLILLCGLLLLLFTYSLAARKANG